jgi:hypothetical protein
MNCAPGCATPNRSVFLWLAIDPLTKLLPVLELGLRTQTMAHRLIHALRQKLAPGCLLLFTGDGLTLYFYALTAHFGQWLTLGRRGCDARRWQAEPDLIYGQVKKSYRRRKLIRVTPVMRLRTEEALTVALQRLGLGGATEHGYYRAGESDHGIHPLVWRPEIFGRTHHLCRSNRAEVVQRRGRRKLRTDQSDINTGHTVRSRGRSLRTFVLVYLEHLHK